MSIYIKGIEMPTSCDDCFLPLRYCPYAMKPDGSCPLIPVPEHGRLIEDVAVREQIDEWLDSVGDVVLGHGLSYYGELLGCIEDAPTIIPADRELET